MNIRRNDRPNGSRLPILSAIAVGGVILVTLSTGVAFAAPGRGHDRGRAHHELDDRRDHPRHVDRRHARRHDRIERRAERRAERRLERRIERRVERRIERRLDRRDRIDRRHRRTLSAPPRIARTHVRRYAPYRTASVWHRGHRHAHVVYEFPVYRRHRVVYEPHVYCGDELYRIGGDVAFGSPRFGFHLRF